MHRGRASLTASRRLLTASRRLLACAAVFVLGGASAVVSCTSTEDPHAGRGRPSTGGSSSSGTSSSGGVDAAAVPEEALDCGSAPGASAPFTKRALLTAASDCAAWHACNFQNAAVTLRQDVQAHAAAPSDATLEAARIAWKSAMNEWSKMELFQFGPAGSKVVDKYHGRGLRSFVHPWPDANRCQVESQVATKTYEQGIGTVLPSGRGLHALEYLLFYPGADTACLPASTAGQAWTALAPGDLVAAKNAYASSVADNVLALALELRGVWLPASEEGEDFKSKLLAFDGYGSEQETLNVVAWSLFYPEKEIKDWKLASLAGVSATPPNREAPFAKVDIENIRANLAAFRSLFQGCGSDGAGVGFDDWLVAAGQQALADEVLAALAKVEAAAETFPSFDAATQAEFAELYAAIKPLSDLLKTRLFGSASPLNLKLPASAASDTD